MKVVSCRGNAYLVHGETVLSSATGDEDHLKHFIFEDTIDQMLLTPPEFVEWWKRPTTRPYRTYFSDMVEGMLGPPGGGYKGGMER